MTEASHTAREFFEGSPVGMVVFDRVLASLHAAYRDVEVRVECRSR